MTESQRVKSLIYSNFTDSSSSILDWVDNYFLKSPDRFLVRPNLNGKWFGFNGGINQDVVVIEEINFLRQKIANLYNLDDFKLVRGLGDSGACIIWLDEGEFLTVHTHNFVKDCCELRFNILLSAPEKGGVVIVDGQTYHVEQDGMYVLDAGLPHGTDTILKSRRVTLSFGWYVHKSFCDSICPNRFMLKENRLNWYNLL